LILFDELAKALRDGTTLDDVEFELKETDQAGNVIAIKYRGCWLMVDNGYLKWSVTMPPFKTSSNRDEVRWSQWLESMRKDVECTFGILKGRWRILKSGIRLHGVDAADKVWLTCCALHNMLIDVDGLDEGWAKGARSDWDGELGNLTNSEAAAILRMQEPSIVRTYDSSGIGRGNDHQNSMDAILEEQELQVEDERRAMANRLAYSTNPLSVWVVRDLSFSFFRERLVEHFQIEFNNPLGRGITWPKRNRLPEPAT
jgi:hypothetical protein